MQTIKRELILLATALLVFIACCWIMLKYGHSINNDYIIFFYMSIWGVSSILWPILAMRCIRKYLISRR